MVEARSRRLSKALVTLFCVVVAVGGWSVSYATQADLAKLHHFALWEAWIWPAIADSAALAVMLRLHLGQVRPGWPTWEAWVTFGLVSGVMVLANTVAIRDDPLGAAMHAILPIVPMLVWHLVIHGRPAAEDVESDGAEDIGRTSERRNGAEDMSGSVSSKRPRSRPTREVVRRLVERYGPDVTPAMVSARTRISRRHAARLLREERRPVVVADEVAQ